MMNDDAKLREAVKNHRTFDPRSLIIDDFAEFRRRLDAEYLERLLAPPEEPPPMWRYWLQDN